MKKGRLSFGVALILIGSAFTLTFSASAASAVPLSDDGTVARVTERGLHHARYRYAERITNESGQVTTREHEFVHLANGMHYFDAATGEYRESDPVFDITPEGRAEANRVAHRVVIDPTADAPIVSIQSPNGPWLQVRVLGLALTDESTGQSLLIGEFKPVQGFLDAQNAGRVIFPDCFDGIEADLVYDIGQARLAQDVILKKSFQIADFGFDPASTRLEIWSEFLQAPEPKKASRRIYEEDPAKRHFKKLPDLTDEDLFFDGLAIIHGQSFLLDPNANGQQAVQNRPIRVGKNWLQLQNRTFLVEAMRGESVSPLLDQLPRGKQAHVGQKRQREAVLAGLGKAQATRTNRLSQLSNPRPIVPSQDKALFAATGLLLDYVIVPDQSNYTFEGDTTYYVTDVADLTGTITIKGGTVIKFARNASLWFYTPNHVDCQTSLFRPAILTAVDDNSVGETIPGSTGSPSGTYGNPAIWIFYDNQDLKHIRISYAHEAVRFYYSAENFTLTHMQMLNSDTGVFAENNPSMETTIYLRNVLMYNLLNGVYGNHYRVTAENITFNGLSLLFGSNDGSGTDFMSVVNSLLVAVTNWNSGPRLTTSFIASDTYATNVFQKVGAGHHYLKNGSTNRNTGTTSINPNLLADLKAMTTFPPQLVTSNISANTTLGTLVQRDTDTPDLGYHYPPLDYLAYRVTISNAVVTLTNGAVLAVNVSSGAGGIDIMTSSVFISDSQPTNLNVIVRSHTLQEQFDTGAGGWYPLFKDDGTAPELHLRFTELPMTGNDGYYVYAPPNLRVLEIRDCVLERGRIWYADSSNLRTVIFANNAWVGTTLNFIGSSSPNLVVTAWNNLFYGGALTVQPPSGNAWSVTDNMIDKTVLGQNSAFTGHNYNGYMNGYGRFSPAGSGDRVLSSSTYVSGPLGTWYLPSNSSLTNAGSRLAGAAGLFHYTAPYPQVRETNSIVDIGFHHVYVDAQNRALDSDNDGIPDFREDANGNGIFDSGETPFTAPTVVLTSPTNGSVFFGVTNVPIQATASSSNSVINQVDFYDGSTLLGQDTSSPYSFTWNAVPGGVHQLTAQATDASGRKATSAVVTITVYNTLFVVGSNTLTAVESNLNTRLQNLGLYSVFKDDDVITSSDADAKRLVVISRSADPLKVGTKFTSNAVPIFTWLETLYDDLLLTGTTTNDFGVLTGRQKNAVLLTNHVIPNGLTGTNDMTTNTWTFAWGTPTTNAVKITRLTGSGSGANNIAIFGYESNALMIGLEAPARRAGFFMGAAPLTDMTSNALRLLDRTIQWVIDSNTPPTVSWIAPTNGGTFVASTNITLSADANDNDSGLKKVSFYRNGIRIGQATTVSNINYQMVWSNAIGGTHLLTAKAFDQGGFSTVSTQLVSVTVLSNALFVTQSTNLNSAETVIKTRLQNLGLVVTVKAATNVTTADALGKTLVVISSSAAASNITNKFTTVQTPVVVWQKDLFDDLGMTATNATEYGVLAGQTQISILNSNHPMAAGFSGTVSVLTNATDVSWGRPGSNAVSIASVVGDPTKVSIFGYDKGRLMVGLQGQTLAAPGRRVGFFLSATNAAFLTGNGWALFDAAILWAIEKPCPYSVDTFLVMDVSMSLSDADFMRSKRSSSNFINSLTPNLDRVGFVTFAGDAQVNSVLTTNGAAVQSMILSVGRRSGTYFHDAIDAARTNMPISAGNVVRAMILSSDGIIGGSQVASNTTLALNAATAAKNAGIRIIAIGYGTNSTGLNLLKQIASSPDDFIYSPDVSEFGDVYGAIADSLCRFSTAPTVVITAPSNGAEFMAPANIVIQADATDSDGIVTNVSFYEGSVKIGQATTAPFNVPWNNVSAGTFALTARATDNQGLMATSTVVIVRVKQPPSVSILTPQNGQTFPAPANIRLTAIAEDSDGYVTNVTYYLGNQNIGSSAASPFSVNWNNLLGGSYSLKAVATDNNGLTGTSVVVAITVVAQPPTVVITNPTNNAIFAQSSPILIETDPRDVDGFPTRVEFFDGAASLAIKSNTPFTFTWSGPAIGGHTLKAVVTDNDGLKGTSGPVVIVVEGCPSPALLTNFVLNTSVILGGSVLTGTVQLASAAIRGGQAINLSCTNDAVIIFGSILVAESQNSATFPIWTKPLPDTISVPVTASLGAVSFTNILQIIGGTGEIAGDTNQQVLQITADTNTAPPIALVRAILGPGVTLFEDSIIFQGDNKSAGLFSGGGQVLGIQSGLVLSSGNITNLTGTNTQCGKQDFFCYYCTDADLASLISADANTNLLHDTTVLEFGFIPDTDLITWEYVFASEEYDDYSHSIYNDVFGFFVNGTNVALLPDGSVVAITNINYDTHAEFYRDNRIGDECFECCNPGVDITPFATEMDGLTTVLRVTAQVNPGVSNHIKLAIGDVSDQYFDSVVMIRAGSVRSGGGVIYVRDDLVHTNFLGMTMTASTRTTVDTNTSYDLRSIDGTVLGARMERSGTVQFNPGNQFDIRWGVQRSNAPTSYASSKSDADLAGSPFAYNTAWSLSKEYHSTIESNLNAFYSLQLVDQITSLCGSNHAVLDRPAGTWPTNKNILTFLTLGRRAVAQGRCLDIVLDNTNAPLNGSWDIALNGEIIASSGLPNGWSVEPDYTVYGGVNVCVPTNALIVPAYEVRFRQGQSTQSGLFNVVAKGTINSAPVLTPLVSSTNAVDISGTVTVTVSLDAPAPGGNAYVSLTTEGPAIGTVPAYVVIPTGERSTSFSYNVQPLSSNTSFAVKASFNGYRKSGIRVLAQAGSPLGAPTINATGEVGQVRVKWSPVLGADSYALNWSTNSSTGFVDIFQGLQTTNFVHTSPVLGVSNYYRVQSVNDYGRSTNSLPAGAIPQPLVNVAKPRIVPGGGIYNDFVAVTIISSTPGSQIWYTTNGSIPTVSGSDSYQYTSTVILSDSVTVRARAFKTGLNDSPVAAATFEISKPTQIACGDIVSGALTVTNAFSVVTGPGRYAVRYSIGKPIGHEVDISVSSAEFDTVLYLMEPSGVLVRANDDISPSNSNSRIVFTIRTNGVHTIEVTSFDPEKIGGFNLSLVCNTNPSIEVFTNGVKIENYAVYDFGAITGGLKGITMTVSNRGLAPLNLSNVLAFPTNWFSVSPTIATGIGTNKSTNLTVQFAANTRGTYEGLLVISNNVASDNPFYINLLGRVIPPPGPPNVTLIFPTNGTLIPNAPVNIQLYATASDEDGITNVAFYRVGISTPLGSTTNLPYTIWWSNVVSGSYTLEARAWDGKGFVSTSAPVAITVGAPSITLTPAGSCVGVSNTAHTVRAAVTNAAGSPVPSLTVTFSVTGANATNTTRTTDASGVATFTYNGINGGLDSISASATVNSQLVTAGAVTKPWARRLGCNQQIYSSIDTTDAQSPGRYSEYYSVTGVAGDILRFTMASTNFSTFMFLQDTNCSLLVGTNEALNANDTYIRYALPASGTYVLQATSYEAYKTGAYTIRLDCGAASGPEIAMTAGGTNVQSYATLDLGSTTNNVAVARTVTITNLGTATLNITGYSFTLTNVFSISPAPITNLAAGAAASFAIQFLATSSGQYTGSLVLTNNDADENPFVVNLTAISNPNGAPPVVTVTTPTNNSRFVLPSSIVIAANATPVGTGVTITNVDFGFRNSQGAFLIGSDTIAPFEIAWAPGQPGTYSVFARAWDSQGRIGMSASVSVEFYPSTQNHSPVANTDNPTVLANSVNNVIDVLANDTDADGDSLTIIAVAPPNVPNHGTAEIINNGKAIRYTPVPNIRGYPADGFSYQISDGKGGTAWGGVLVTVDASDMPYVQWVWPFDGYPTNAGRQVSLQVHVTPAANIVKVEFYRGLEKLGEATNGVAGDYILNWIADTENCHCGFTATATDKFGQAGTSQPPIFINVDPPFGVELPVATFDNLTGPAVKYAGQWITNIATITEGLFDLYGRAYQPQGSNVTWNLEVHDLKGNLVRQFTPAPRDASGFHTGAVGSATSSNLLATCDFTTLRNDIYDMILHVRGGFRTAQRVVRFRLESDLKIGQFTFTEQDMSIPVMGIPLVVTRTYDSMNPISGDFGFGWTYSTMDLQITLDEERVAAQDTDGTDFSLRIGGGRDVMLTLPGGRRATFAFVWEPVQCTEGAWASFCLAPRFQSPPGLTVKLEVVGDHRYDILNNRWQQNGQTSAEWYEFPGYTLTLEDGTVFNIAREQQGNFFMDDPPDETLMAGDINVVAYNPPYLSSIVQQTGDKIEIQRDSLGRSSRIQHKDSLGGVTRSIVFGRDNEGRITSISDPLGQDPGGQPTGQPAIKYEYDGAGNLSKVLKLVDRTSGSYLTNYYYYDHPKFPHYITQIVNARGKLVARNLYDDTGRLIGLVDVYGRTNRFEHDVVNHREIQYDRFGQATILQYDSKGNVLNVVDPLGNTSAFLYDANGYRATSSDALGNTTYYTNDVSGNLLAVVLPHPPGTDAAAFTTLFTYDGDGNRTSKTLPTGGTITNQYDSSGNLTMTRDGDNNVLSTTVYNGRGLPQIESDHFSVLSYGYDGFGNLQYVTNTHNQVVVSGYDANGNLTNLVKSGITRIVAYDALNRQTSVDYGSGVTANYTYDADGTWSNLAGPTSPGVGRSLEDSGKLSDWKIGNKSQLSYAYDFDGRLEFVTNAMAAVLQTLYDVAGRVVGESNLMTGAGTTFGYDPAGRNTTITNALGYSVGVGYNPDDSVSTVTNELQRVWLYDYQVGGGCCGSAENTRTVTDPLGRQMTEVRSAYGLPVSMVWRSGTQVSSNLIQYVAGLTTPQQEAEDYPTAIVDEAGRTRRFDYTSLGQLNRATDLGGTVWWTNQYDSISGTLTNVVSPTGETLGYIYDSRNNLATLNFGDGGYLTNYYDSQNLLASNRLPSGSSVTFRYDSMRRLTNRTSTAGDTATFLYTNADAVSVMIDNTGSTTNMYDAAGRLKGVDYPSGGSVRFSLDLLNRITGMTNKGSTAGPAYVTRYGYDAAGNVTNIVDPFNGQTTIEYDRVGRRTRRTLPNSVVTEWLYDWRDRVTNVVHKRDGAVFSSFGYVRNPDGEPSRVTREDGTYVDLQYDAALRLTNEVYKTAAGALIEQISYGYDSSGSRTRLVKGGVTLTNNVTLGYRITAVKNAATGSTTENYAYDSAGRITSIGRDGLTFTVGYSAADKTTAFTNGATWVTYRYDGLGRRTVSTNASGSVRRFLVGHTPGTALESPQLIADGSGTVQQGYVYLRDEPILRYDAAGNRVYYLEDAMGSIASLTDANGAAIASFQYDGFGNVRTQTGSTGAPNGTGGDFRFHRAWWEADSGLYHMRARDYDPRLGRFTTRDARNGVIQRPETLHPYTFAVNNPFIFADPSGEFTVIEINVVELIDSSLQALKQVVINRIKAKVKDAIFEAVSSIVVDQISVIYPPLGQVWKVLKEKGGRNAGNFLEDQLIARVCAATGMASFLKYIYFFPGIHEADGKAIFDGFNCKTLSAPDLKKGNRYPDFIISDTPPKETSTGEGGKSILVGDIKLSGNSLYNKYIDKSNKYYDGPGQFDAMSRYAGQYSYTHIVLFLTMFTGDKPKLTQVRLLLQGDALKDGVAVFVVAALKNKGFDDK